MLLAGGRGELRDDGVDRVDIDADVQCQRLGRGGEEKLGVFAAAIRKIRLEGVVAEGLLRGKGSWSVEAVGSFLVESLEWVYREKP